MEEFKKGEIILYKDYTEEKDWELGVYLKYDEKGYEEKHHVISRYITDFENNVFAIDKIPTYRRYVKKLPNINFGNGVIWGEKEEHAD